MREQKEFDKELIAFIHDTTVVDGDIKAYVEVAQKHCDKLFEGMQVGKIVYRIDAKPNLTLPQGENAEYLIYEKKGDIELGAAYTQDYILSLGGNMSFLFYPVKGIEFTEEQKKLMNHIADVWFVTGGRLRSIRLCNNAISTDLQTGVANISAFKEQMGKLIAMHKISEYNAYYLNCKNFKYFNKTYGYANGNAIIEGYAKRLDDFCQGEEMVARLGGDNFATLIHKDHAKAFMGMLIGTDVTIMDGETQRDVVVSAIAGIYEIDNVVSPSEVMMAISYSVQMARAIHQDFVYFNKDMEKRIEDSQKLLMDFDTYLENGEFVAFLQPKNDINTGAICGAEALARQIHQNAMISPMQFIPTLEREGAICKLDFEMLRQVCEQIAKWCAEGITPPRISVNFSRWHLQNNNFVNDVMKIISDYQINPKYIEIELTETVDSDEYVALAELFEQFKKNGLSTSIDDFGSGYSSLKLIMNLDVDVLKIDQMFIQDMEKHSKKRIVFSNVVRMAQEIGVEVLAEGVETKEQRDIIKEYGCHVAQGFYYYKPMPMAEFEKLLKA